MFRLCVEWQLLVSASTPSSVGLLARYAGISFLLFGGASGFCHFVVLSINRPRQRTEEAWSRTVLPGVSAADVLPI
jgi:hypothetical protein